MSKTETGTLTLYVQPHLAGFWRVTSDRAEVAGNVYATQHDALSTARKLARAWMPSRIVLFDLGGSLRAEYDYRDNPLETLPFIPGKNSPAIEMKQGR